MGKPAVYLSALRLEDGELLILASSQQPEGALNRYIHRWEIETLFACLKGRGFRFESTRLTAQDRIENMMAVLAIAFAWAHKMGDWLHTERKAITVKRHQRLAISYFRYGLDWIRRALVGFTPQPDKLAQCLKVLINSWPKLSAISRIE